MTTIQLPREQLFAQPRDTELPLRSAAEVIHDFMDIHSPPTGVQVHGEALACIRCQVPLCSTAKQGGCPLQNPIPLWHGLMSNGLYEQAWRLLEGSNPLPEMMTACPKPCEHTCVAGQNSNPDATQFPHIGIGITEQGLWNRACEEGWVRDLAPYEPENGKCIAIIGSGPGAMAAAIVLRRAGFTVEIFERSDLLGGLLTEGIPNFHLDKQRVHARLAWMASGGIQFHSGIEVGGERHPLERCADRFQITLDTQKNIVRIFDHVILALGATVPRELDPDFPGRSLAGVHHAMELLTDQNRVDLGKNRPKPIQIAGHRMAIIGGGLTGLDVRSTGIRQSRNLTPLTVVRRQQPSAGQLRACWLEPVDPLRDVLQFREGGRTAFGAHPVAFEDNDGKGSVTHVVLKDLHGGTATIEASRVFLACGFFGPGKLENGITSQLDITCNVNGRIMVDSQFATNQPGVFAIGDCIAHSGDDLIVTAVAHGRDAAQNIIDRLV